MTRPSGIVVYFTNRCEIRRKCGREEIVYVFVHEDTCMKFVNISESKGVQLCK